MLLLVSLVTRDGKSDWERLCFTFGTGSSIITRTASFAEVNFAEANFAGEAAAAANAKID
jgi:hypothetical protein